MTANLFIAAEILLLAYVAGLCVAIFRTPFLSNLALFAALCLAFGVACAATRAAENIAGLFTANPFILVTSGALFSLPVFFGVYYWLKHLVNRRRRAGRSAPTRPGSGLGFVLNLGMALIVIAVFVAIADMLAGLADLSPLRPIVRNGSLYCRYLVPPDDRPNPATLDSDMDKQAEFLAGLRRTFTGAKDAIAERIGTRRMIDGVAALIDILNLPGDDMAWLMENEPALKRLKDNRLLRETVNDEKILQLVLEVGNGSVSAIYKLGDEPRIQALASDGDIKRTIAALDLVGLRDTARARARQRERVVPVAWSVASIARPTEMDTAPSDPGRWTEQSRPGRSIAWDPGARFGLVKAEFDAEPGAAVVVCCESDGAPALWSNDTRMDMRRRSGRYEAEITIGPGRTTLVMMLDFRAATNRTARVYLVNAIP